MQAMTVTDVFKDQRDGRPYLFVVRDEKGAKTYRASTESSAARKRRKVIAALRAQGHELKVL